VARLCECALGWQEGGGAAVCMGVRGRVWVDGCAGAFQTAHHQIERNPASGWFNVTKHKGKWVGVVKARGVELRTSPHAEAWRAAVELEWLLDRWCRKHGASEPVGLLVCCHRHIVRAAVWAQGFHGASW
jgi:hypothetical protein